MSACKHCPSAAVILQRHSGEHLCGEHFSRSVERRATREIARHNISEGAMVACALSGGKDSIAALRLAHRYLGRAGVSIGALTIDEGIEGYRSEGIEVARRACEELGVEHVIVRYQDRFGKTTDQMAAELDEGAPCSPCGVFRRSALNQAAREMGASRLVTGHNLDDTAQSVLMNLLRGDVQRLARMAAHDNAARVPASAPGSWDGGRSGLHAPERPGLVPRMMPLRMVPEREVALYAHLQGWEVHRGECPHAALAQRGAVRDALLALEERVPGARHGLVASLERMAPALQGAPQLQANLRACEECGEPTSGTRCRACAMAARVTGAGSA